MRCRFASLNSPTEQECLRRFDERAQRFYELVSSRAWGRLRDALAEVDGEFELVTARVDGDVAGLEVRSSVVKRAWLERFAGARPPGVEVVTERGPLDFESACERVAERTGFDVSEARVRAGVTRGHLFEIVLYLHEASAEQGAAAELAAELAVESCLGERSVETWVQSIDVAALPRKSRLKVVQSGPPSAESFPLAELKPTIDRAVQGVLDSLPDEPLCRQAPKSNWVMLETEPLDDSTEAQADLIMASTCLPEMLKCYLQQSPFTSARFSRHGEHFVYVKYPAQGDPAERVRARQGLEDALDVELRSRGLGCVVGNGLGRNHCYIDFALTSLNESLPWLCEAAQRAGFPRRATLLFCDSELQDEWIELWDPPFQLA